MKNLIIAFVLAAGFNAIAQQVQFGEMVYGGTGCPAGSLTQMEIADTSGKLYLDLNVSADKNNLALLNRKSCNVRLPMSITAGFQVGIHVRKVQGFIAQDKKVKSTLEARAGLVGSLSLQKLLKAWASPINSNFELISDLTPLDNYIWSSCGRDTMLTLDTNAVVMRSKKSQNGLVAVSEINFDFIVRRCN